MHDNVTIALRSHLSVLQSVIQVLFEIDMHVDPRWSGGGGGTVNMEEPNKIVLFPYVQLQVRKDWERVAVYLEC